MRAETRPDVEVETTTMSDGPFFSIVIATWNRAPVIGRCLDSITRQDFEDFEVLVVDGNSADGTADVVDACGDPRVRAIREPENSGVWGAKNLGLRSSRGAWILILDSDDELTDGALGRFHRRALAAPADVGMLGGSYRMDDGRTEPDPPLPAGPIGFEEYAGWLNEVVLADYLKVIRREVLETTGLPPPRGRGTLFELEVFDHWRKDISADICGIVHTDMPNRLIGKGKGFSRELLMFQAEQSAEVFGKVISKYGDRLRPVAPRFLTDTHRQAALMHLTGGKRLTGASYMARYLLRRPMDLKAWGVLLTGLIGPGTLMWSRRHLR